MGLLQLVVDVGLELGSEIFGDDAGEDTPGQAVAFLFELGDAGAGVADLRLGLGLLVVKFDL